MDGVIFEFLRCYNLHLTKDFMDMRDNALTSLGDTAITSLAPLMVLCLILLVMAVYYLLQNTMDVPEALPTKHYIICWSFLFVG